MALKMRPTFYSITVQTSTAMITMFPFIFIPPGTGSHGSIRYPRVNTVTGSCSTGGETACLTGLPGSPSSVNGVLYERKHWDISILFSNYCNKNDVSKYSFIILTSLEPVQIYTNFLLFISIKHQYILPPSEA